MDFVTALFASAGILLLIYLLIALLKPEKFL